MIPGLGRSPGEGDGNPFQHSCLGNVTDREPWRAAVHGVTKSQTCLNNILEGVSPGTQLARLSSILEANVRSSEKYARKRIPLRAMLRHAQRHEPFPAQPVLNQRACLPVT